MNERKVLGRGLKSLIPTYPPAPLEVGGEIHDVPISRIRTNPRQPRRYFSEAALEGLTQSIRRSGILQPLLVRKTDDGYELIAGERRLRASKRAGLEQVPVVVRRGNDQDQLELALIENLQREDLTPIEEAKGYERLIQEFTLTQEEIAARVGKERSTISNLIRLLKLSLTVQEMISRGAISMGHARAILPLEDHRRQEELAQRIEREGLSVRQVEILVRSMLSQTQLKSRRRADLASQNSTLHHVSDELQRSLGTRVEIVSRGKGGEIRIQYYSPEDLQRLTLQIGRPLEP